MSAKIALCVLEWQEGHVLSPRAKDVLSYAAASADTTQLWLVGNDLPTEVVAQLEEQGVDILVTCPPKTTNPWSVEAEAHLLSAYLKAHSISFVLGIQSLQTQALFAHLSALSGCLLVPHVVSLPEQDKESSSALLRCSAYTGKAFARLSVPMEETQLLLLHSHITAPYGGAKKTLKKEIFTPPALPSDLPSARINIKNQTRVAQKQVPLSEASIVVSGGRGMKGPENWHLIENLADALGAATACSKPVSDMEWRPHHEHVGQTGIKINPELYIAVGISGAVQHLAGVNASKVIVVINSDAEAPFFQSADYGIQGDAFDVLPKLIDSLKNYQTNAS